jgi:Tfp pilus assembly protein PilV
MTIRDTPNTNFRQIGPKAGYTFIELVVSMSVFSLAILGIMACHLAGLRFNLFVLPKIQNAQYSRQTLSHMVEEVRCATSIQVGSGTFSTFTKAGATNSQSGNALRIFPSTNTTQFIYYYRDPTYLTLNKVPLNGTNAVTVANTVTNSTVFSMQDFSGTVLTNNQNNAVLRVLLQMNRTQPITGATDPYQIEAKITRRNIL